MFILCFLLINIHAYVLTDTYFKGLLTITLNIHFIFKVHKKTAL